MGAAASIAKQNPQLTMEIVELLKHVELNPQTISKIRACIANSSNGTSSAYGRRVSKRKSRKVKKSKRRSNRKRKSRK